MKKNTFIEDIQAGIGLDDIFVLAQKSLLQKKDGKNYLNILLADKTGHLKGVVWDRVEKITAAVKSGDFVQVQGTVSEYRGGLQLVVKEMLPCQAADVNPADFIPTSRRNIEEMFKRLVKLCQSMQTPELHMLLEAFWNDAEFVHRFKTAPAAKKMHHAYLGGLLEHTLSMAILSDKMAEHYGGIDRDLLLAGAVLHDIGKIEELEFSSKIDYSDQGRLLNHIVIGIRLIEEKISRIDAFTDEKGLLLKHLIISHHGSRELGSPEPPKTVEAVLLNYIDEIDSKINGIRDFMAKEDPGARWTSYHRILERYFYKGTD